jgi:hypothetical protein
MKKYLICDEETRDMYGEDFILAFEFTMDAIREVEKIAEDADWKDMYFEWCGKWLIVAGDYIPIEKRTEPLPDGIDRRFQIPNMEPAVSVYRRAALDHRDLAVALKKLGVIFETCK